MDPNVNLFRSRDGGRTFDPSPTGVQSIRKHSKALACLLACLLVRLLACVLACLCTGLFPAPNDRLARIFVWQDRSARDKRRRDIHFIHWRGLHRGVASFLIFAPFAELRNNRRAVQCRSSSPPPGGWTRRRNRPPARRVYSFPLTFYTVSK